MESAGFPRPIAEPVSHEASARHQLQEDSHPKPEITKQPVGSVKRYHRIKLIAGLIHSSLLFALSIVVLSVGITRMLESLIREFVSNDYLVLLGFAGVFGFAETLSGLPIRYAFGYRLERAYSLTNQSLGSWIWEKTKGLLVSIPLVSILLFILYFCIRSYGFWWWIPVAGTMFLFSVLLVRLAPILIFPLFYTFTPLEQGALRDRIASFCERAGVKVRGIFVFNLSKTTKKANAAFTGIGKSRRIILGDTLLANFTDDEIETVFAHEMGHYTMNHVWKMVAIGALSTAVGLYLTALLYDASLSWFGFEGRDTIAALPLLGLWLSLYSLVTSPLNNMLSRANEREADAYAVRASGNKDAFIGALRKLGRVNMADVSPHPVIEFLFHSHPSIEKRIRTVEGM